jgi:hypothetical protein
MKHTQQILLLILTGIMMTCLFSTAKSYASGDNDEMLIKLSQSSKQTLPRAIEKRAVTPNKTDGTIKTDNKSTVNVPTKMGKAITKEQLECPIKSSLHLPDQMEAEAYVISGINVLRWHVGGYSNESTVPEDGYIIERIYVKDKVKQGSWMQIANVEKKGTGKDQRYEFYDESFDGTGYKAGVYRMKSYDASGCSEYAYFMQAPNGARSDNICNRIDCFYTLEH